MSNFAIVPGPWKPRFVMMQGLMCSWSDHKIDFALSFLGRTLSLDRNSEASLTSTLTASRDVRTAVSTSTGFKGLGAEWLGKSVPAPQNMREMLQKESLQIKLSAADVGVDLFVAGRELAKSIKARLTCGTSVTCVTLCYIMLRDVT